MVAENPFALQHQADSIRPRPLPLFLDLVAKYAATDPESAKNALAGVRRYQRAERQAHLKRPVFGEFGRVTITAAGDSGPLVLLIPSLINPSRILDIDAEGSLLGWLGAQGFRAMLVDWGHPAPDERAVDIGGHVSELLLPLLDALQEPAHLVGYCLGGTMALAAAALHEARSLTMLAAPWHFSGYTDEARDHLTSLWAGNGSMIDALGQMPMELLQSAFWGLDPDRTVRKFAAIAALAEGSPALNRFVAIEDWANDGPPLTAAAARQLLCDFMHDDSPGRGRWRVGGQIIDPGSLSVPARQFVAHDDRIVPAATTCSAIDAVACPAGHVGMIIGSRAMSTTFEPLAAWLRSV